MSKVPFYKRHLAPLVHRKWSPAVIAMSGTIATIFFFGMIYYTVDQQHQMKVREWNAGVAKAIKYQEVAVPRIFRAWSANVVRKDGAIERWAGANSEIVFIDYQPSCISNKYIERKLPCWTVYARTQGTARYFTVDAEVDENWRIKFAQQHKEIPLQSVVERALQLGRDDVVKRLSVAKTDA